MAVRPTISVGAGAALSPYQIYNFNGGINTVAANEDLPLNVSPFLRNVRYNRFETITTRKGAGFYSTPVGETQDTSQTSTTGASTAAITPTTKLAAKFIAATTGALTRLDLNLKTTTPAGTGTIMVEVWSDNAGTPGSLLASSSINPGVLTSTATYWPARYLNPANIVSGTTYWVVSYIQSPGTNSYLWTNTTAATTAQTYNGAAWSSTTYALNIKTYVSPASPVIGRVRFYQSTGTKTEVFATKAGVFTVNDTTGAVTQIFSGTTTATQYVFEQFQDVLYWVNGVDAPQQWNGTTVSPVAGIETHLSQRGVTGQPLYVQLHKNLLFFALTDQIIFSAVGDPTTYPSTNFIYPAAPKTPDPIVKLVSLQDYLFIRTRGTRWQLSGSDVSTFTLRRSTGLQGCVGAFGSMTHENFEYFVSDNGIYWFNGATDKLISEAIQPDFDAITDKTKITLVISGNYLRVFYPVSGNSSQSQAFIYDFIFGIWFIDDNAYFSGGNVQKGNGDPETLVLGSSVVGAVYFADRGYNDLGAPINFQYWTKYESYGVYRNRILATGEPAAQKQIRRFYPEFTSQGSNYALPIYVDKDFANAPTLVSNVQLGNGGDLYGSTFTYGTSKYATFSSIKPRLSVPGQLYRRQYRFIFSSVDQPVEVLGFAEYYVRRRPR